MPARSSQSEVEQAVRLLVAAQPKIIDFQYLCLLQDHVQESLSLSSNPGSVRQSPQLLLNIVCRGPIRGKFCAICRHSYGQALGAATVTHSCRDETKTSTIDDETRLFNASKSKRLHS